MSRYFSILFSTAMLVGCQTNGEDLVAVATSANVSGPAASVIAGDMAGRLAEQMRTPKTTPLKITNDKSDYYVALESALKGWGYIVISDNETSKDAKPVALSWSLDNANGQTLARISTPSVAIARAYTISVSGAAPSSPLSILQRN